MANEVDIWINAARIVTTEHHGTHKSHVAETYGKQGPGKFNISVVKTLSGFTCPRRMIIKSAGFVFLSVNLRVLPEVQIWLDDPPPHGDVAGHDEDEGKGEADAEEEGARVDESGLCVDHVTIP